MPRVLTLALGLTAVALALTGPARGDNPAAPPAGEAPAADPSHFPRVHVEPTAGAAEFEGTLRLATIRVRTDTDTRDIDLKHVTRVTLAGSGAEKGQDAVELDSHDTVHGKVLTDEFPVEVGPDDVRRLKASEVRELRTIKERPLSPVGIAIGLLTLTAMEIVLGIDNIIFLAIVTARLPEHQQPKARKLGLAAALGTRLLLLLSLSFLLGLTAPLFTLPDLPLLHNLEAREVSWRDVILIAGGAFLIGKSTLEMHEKLEHAKAEAAGTPRPAGTAPGFVRAIVTIAVIDIVFSLDSVITAVGMVEQVWVMMTAMVMAMGVMLVFSAPISRFVDRHPTIKVLALAFLILIGVMLVAEGLGQHMDKGYIYFAMGFAVGIEMINMRLRRGAGGKSSPQRHEGEDTKATKNPRHE